MKGKGGRVAKKAKQKKKRSARLRVLPTPNYYPSTGAGLKRRKRIKRGGYILPLVTGGIAAASGIIKAWKSIENSKKVLKENIRHHHELERLLREKSTLNIKSGSGLKRKRKKKCRKNQISFL